MKKFQQEPKIDLIFSLIKNYTRKINVRALLVWIFSTLRFTRAALIQLMFLDIFDHSIVEQVLHRESPCDESPRER